MYLSEKELLAVDNKTTELWDGQDQVCGKSRNALECPSLAHVLADKNIWLKIQQGYEEEHAFHANHPRERGSHAAFNLSTRSLDEEQKDDLHQRHDYCLGFFFR